MLLLDIYSSYWSHKTQTFQKLRIYVTFKDMYNVQKYVLLEFKQKRSFSASPNQIIKRQLPLWIEMGRYPGKKPEERLCIICQSGQTNGRWRTFSADGVHYTELRNNPISTTNQRNSFVSLSDVKTTSPMGNDRSHGSQHNLQCSKAGNSELETVIRNKFKI